MAQGLRQQKKLFDLSADVLVTGNGPGGNAAEVLKKTELKIFVGAADMTIKGAYEAFKSGSLSAL